MASEDISFAINAKGAESAARGLLQVANTSEKLENNMGALSIAAKGLQAAFAPLIAALAAVQVTQKVTELVKSSTEAYIDYMKASQGATESQLKFANSIEKTLAIADNVTLGLMDQAGVLGISETHLKQATLAAIGLSQATGQGLEESLKKVNQAIRGNANAFGEAIPGLAKLTTEQEKLNAISKLANSGLSEQREEAQGLIGAQSRAANATEDLLESIGAIIAPLQTLIYNGFGTFAELLNSALVPAVRASQFAMSGMRNVIKAYTNEWIAAYSAVKVFVDNSQNIIQLGAATFELKFLQITGAAKHAFLVEIPAYTTWFAENFVNIIRDGFSAAYTIVENTILNMSDVIMQLWDWVSSGMEGGSEELFRRVGAAASRSLLEGFEAKTQSLPEIIGRQITSQEQELLRTIGKLSMKLANQFSSTFNAGIKDVGETLKNVQPKVVLTQDKLAMDLGGSVKGKADTSLKVVESRIMTRGRADDQSKLISENTKVAADVLKTIRGQLDTIINEPKDESMKVEVVE